MSIAFGWQPSEWQEFTLSGVELALEQAEEVVQDRKYEESVNHAMVAATIVNVNSGKKKKLKVTDFIGEPPWKEREKQQEQAEDDKEKLRQIAMNKGLAADF